MTLISGATDATFGWFRQHLSALQLCWACIFVTGGLAFFADNRYAKAEEMSNMHGTVVDVQMQLLQADLLEVRFRQCKDNTGQKEWYALRIGDLQKTYAHLDEHGNPFALPACGEL